MSRPRITFRTAVAALILLGILVLTLAPVANRPPLPFSLDVAVGRRWLADGILNLFLFVPLGLAVGWNSRSLTGPVFFGFLLSIFVELVQMVVPGRDPALGDILFNTLGAATGALMARRPEAWLEPRGTTSKMLALSGIVVAASLMIATALLLAPVGGEDTLSINRNGDDLVLWYPSRAGALGLDQPEYWLHAAIPGSAGAGAMPVSARRERGHWLISTGTARQATIGPTVGQGWAMLAYPDAIGRRWSSFTNAVWMLGLCLPVGFWARGRVGPLAAAVLVMLLVLVPKLTGTVATSGLEWFGAVVGFTAGAYLGAFVPVRLRRL